MTYEINRIERKVKNGVDEVFVEIEYCDDLGVHNFGHWLTSPELQRYLSDENYINIVAEKYTIEARNLKILELQTLQAQSTQQI